jgi:hypothetical protein
MGLPLTCGPGGCASANLFGLTQTLEPISAAILCTGRLDVIKKEAWLFCRTSSGFRVQGLGFRVLCFGLRVEGLRFKVLC